MGEIWNFFKLLGRISKELFWDMPMFAVRFAVPVMQGEGDWRTKTAAVLFGVGGVLMLLSFVSLACALIFDWPRVFTAGWMFFGWGLMFGIPGYFLFPSAGAGDQHLRGAEWMGSGQRQSLVKTGDPLQIKIGGIPIPRWLETTHFLVSGTTGAGKSLAINGLLDTLRARQADRVVMADAGGEAMQRWFMDGDLILNPLDERSANWSPFAEMRDPWDSELLTRSIIPEGEGSTKEWNGYARQAVGVALRRLWETGQASNGKLVAVLTLSTNEEMLALVEGLPVASLFGKGSEKMLASVRAIIGAHLGAYAYLNPAAGVDGWSIRRWIESTDAGETSWLWIPYTDTQVETLRPLICAWADLAVSFTLSLRASDTRAIWLIADELAALGQVSSLKGALARGRRYGLRCVFGLQVLSQFREAYGRDGAQTLLGCISNWLILRAGDAETAAEMSRHLGEAELLRTDESSSRSDNGESTSRSTRHVIEKIMLPSEIMNLPARSGVLCLGEDFRLAPVEIPFFKKPEVIPPFIAKKRPALSVPAAAPAAEPVVQTAPVAAAPSIAAPDLD